jgi:Zn-dependent peptidase ImmA (M78 family)
MFVESERQSHSQQEADALEEEANAFSTETLIPKKALDDWLINIRNPSKADVVAFAKEIGIAPGIVVGRLQYMRKIPNIHFNDLKQRYEWSDLEG